MKTKNLSLSTSLIFILVFIMSACSTFGTAVIPTDTPAPTATITLTSTRTPHPSPTPQPTKTPDLAATQKYEGFNAETQKYFDLGYLTTTEGKLQEYDDFAEYWAQMDYYRGWFFDDEASDFYMSAHIKWSSAYRNANISGCGFNFSIQPNDEYEYAVFLDRSKVYFVETEHFYNAIGPTRGTGRVKFDNPFDKPDEADFTLIVKGAYAYVLVDGELVGEYSLSSSKALRGKFGFAILSGTNKGFGTRCKWTNVHSWIPK